MRRWAWGSTGLVALCLVCAGVYLAVRGRPLARPQASPPPAVSASPTRPPLAAEDETFTKMRHEMVERTIRARDVTDPAVLRAMEVVPRHRFVLDRYRDQAYADHPLPIGYGQTISQPYIVALMTELLALTPDQRVLEIGTGSGYQAAVLAELVQEVHTVEIVPSWPSSAATACGS